MSDTVVQTEPGISLLNRLWKTKGSRFVARERLRVTHTLSMTSVSILSGYVIILSIVLLAFADILHDDSERWLNVANIALSVTIIAFSLIEAARDHLGSAESMNQSALRIGELYGRLSAKLASKTLRTEELESMEVEYASILREAKLNHTTSDFTLFKIQNWKEFQSEVPRNVLARNSIRFCIWISNYWLYIFSICFFPILVVASGKVLFVGS